MGGSFLQSGAGLLDLGILVGGEARVISRFLNTRHRTERRLGPRARTAPFPWLYSLCWAVLSGWPLWACLRAFPGRGAHWGPCSLITLGGAQGSVCPLASVEPIGVLSCPEHQDWGGGSSQQGLPPRAPLYPSCFASSQQDTKHHPNLLWTR